MAPLCGGIVLEEEESKKSDESERDVKINQFGSFWKDLAPLCGGSVLEEEEGSYTWEWLHHLSHIEVKAMSKAHTL